MDRPYSTALSIARVFLWVLLVLNLIAGVAMLGWFPASFIFDDWFTKFFSKRPGRIDASWLMPALRVWIVLGLAMVAAVHVQLRRLIEMVETVRDGDPFVPENAVRLHTIARCLLAVQLLDLSFGAMAATMNAAGSSIQWKFSATGWLAVVLLFVLARVFEEGTRMRADLESMI